MSTDLDPEPWVHKCAFSTCESIGERFGWWEGGAANERFEPRLGYEQDYWKYRNQGLDNLCGND